MSTAARIQTISEHVPALEPEALATHAVIASAYKRTDYAPAWFWIAKRIFDLGLALTLLVLLAPLLALVAFAIKLESRGPALFTQVRVREGMRPFRIFKFRTMHLNVEPIPQAVFDEARAKFRRPTFHEDPRMTRVGRVLRTFSMDELPQILNILRGEMSFVGPRPLTEIETAGVPREALLRYAVPSGITGLAQVKDRAAIVDVSRFHHDLEYVRTLSLRREAWIVLNTVFRLYDRGV
jgi:lipopolysaccharide/colanic/teichoic acid biosynthesis glycosyltransferase